MKELPESFLTRMRQITDGEFSAFVSSLSSPPPVSVRVNPFKKSGVFIDEEKISWSRDGLYLKERPSFTMDPLFHAGCYYVQEPSSQFLEQVFLQVRKSLKGPIRILDLCAAPGGKSTHILSLMNDSDVLVSNEIIASRNNILKENIMKWGRSNVIVTQNDPGDFSRVKEFFDVVIVDAPCSGEGLFRKDENAIDEWSEDNVKQCTQRQKEILVHANATLKNGGFLIYSTCTFEKSENDNQIELLTGTYELNQQEIENKFPGILKSDHGLVFYPHRIRGEGFYISLLQKNNGENRSIKKESIKQEHKYKTLLENYIVDAGNFSAIVKDDRLYAIPNSIIDSFLYLNKNLYVRHAGIPSGEFKGNDFIPSQALALSTELRTDLVSSELSLSEAIEYLKGISPAIESPKGWSLVRYKSFNLGWIKNIGSRINNYYPKEWRIRKLAN